jgi:xanthine dehydrogenase molybdopterin-binding subunit B
LAEATAGDTQSALSHEAAWHHVTGRTVYLDDLPTYAEELLVDFVGSPLAHARLSAIDIAPVAAIDGITGVFTTADCARRRTAADWFSATSRTHFRGLALTPIKLGISFTRRTLNQANALVNFASSEHGIEASPDRIEFDRVRVRDVRRPGQDLGFAELVRLAYERRVNLGDRGFHRTPGIDFNRATGRGNRFYYFKNGAAVSEVLIDRLTGELRVARVDILIDAGWSINPAIDRGQVAGGFIQGMSWVTTEELRYSGRGELLTQSPNNDKIPSAECVPPDCRVALLERSAEPANLLGSKGLGEPPFVLGLSVWAAVKQALGAERRLARTGPGRSPGLSLPATSEEILRHLAQPGGGASEIREEETSRAICVE